MAAFGKSGSGMFKLGKGYLVEYEDGTTAGALNNGIWVVPDNRYNVASIAKTGQTTSYVANDDGALERGRGSSFTVLNNNNPYGNTNRFTDSAGGQTYANDEVYDWLYADYVNGIVPVWYRIIKGPDTWANVLAGQPYSFNAVNWYVPNITELSTLCDYKSADPLNYSPLNVSFTNGVWSTTTPKSNTTLAKIVYSPGVGNITKTNGTYQYILIRYVSF